MLNFKLDPIKKCTLFLAIFLGTAIAYNRSLETLLHLGIILAFGLALYALFTKLSGKRKNVWDTAITCLLICLVLHYGTSSLEMFFYPLLATAIAITIKFFVDWKGSPIVNPAAAGILISAGIGVAFGMELPFVSWWGASFWSLPIGVPASLLLLAVWIFGGFAVWRKWPIFMSFLLVYAGLYFLRVGAEGLQFTYTDSFIYFFASVMLPEPKTSPFLPWKQVAYGSLAAITMAGFSQLGIFAPELFAILAANLLNAGFKWKPTPRPAVPAA